MKRRWHDYDDGFDETTLHEDEDLEFPGMERWPAVTARPKLRAAPRKPKKYVKEDETERQRIARARVKAWGLPY